MPKRATPDKPKKRGDTSTKAKKVATNAETGKHPGGRPTAYKAEYSKLVLEVVGQDGKSVTQFARDLRISRDTVYEWAKQHVEFSDALLQAQEWSQACWEDKLATMMLSRDVNAPLVKLYFANRFGWTDKQETSLKGSLSITHENALSELDDEQ